MTANTTDALLKRCGWLLLALIAAMTLLPGTDTLPLIDRDEPRFTRATLEMMERGEWVVPYFNGDYRFDKPPLTYWWMRLNFALFGQHDFAARLHSVLASWLCALAIFAMGSRMFRPATGFLAGVAFLTCFQVGIHGRLAVADMPMVLAVILIQWAAWEIWHLRPWRPYSKWFFLLYLSLAFGFLAKGPIVFLVPLLSWLLLRVLLWRKPIPWHRLQWFNGPLLSLVVISLWGIPALVSTDGAFWEVGIGEHIVKRGTEAFNDRASFPLYYLLSSFLSLMPWVAFLGAVVLKLRDNWDERAAFLVAWAVAPMLIFSFYATQLPHYTLPGYAAFFLLVFLPAKAGVLPMVGLRASRWERLSFRLITGLWCVVTLGLLAVVSLETITPALQPLQLALAAVALFLVGQLGMAVGFRGTPSGAVSGLLFGLLCSAAAWAAIGPNLRSLLPANTLQPTFAAQALATQPPEPEAEAPTFFGITVGRNEPETAMRPWVGIGYSEPSLVYYSDSYWDFAWMSDAANQLATPNARGFILRAREWRLANYAEHLATARPLEPVDDVTDRLPPPPPGYASATLQGINLARFSWVELRIYVPKSLAESLP